MQLYQQGHVTTGVGAHTPYSICPSPKWRRPHCLNKKNKTEQKKKTKKETIQKKIKQSKISMGRKKIYG
jgi:hypothetical protein